MNRNTTIALLVVLGALGLYYFLVQVPKDKTAAAASPTPLAGASLGTVWQTTSDQVTGVRFEDRVNHKQVAFSKDASGGWSVTAPEAQPGDPGAVGIATSALAALPVSQLITGTTDLAAFGLVGAQYRVELALADGQTLKASIGDKTPTGSGYYLQRDGDADVLVVASYGVDSVIGLLDKPPYQPTATPEPTVAPTAAAGETPPVLTATP